jgi:hypothetical protein
LRGPGRFDRIGAHGGRSRRVGSTISANWVAAEVLAGLVVQPDPSPQCRSRRVPGSRSPSQSNRCGRTDMNRGRAIVAPGIVLLLVVLLTGCAELNPLGSTARYEKLMICRSSTTPRTWALANDGRTVILIDNRDGLLRTWSLKTTLVELNVSDNCTTAVGRAVAKPEVFLFSETVTDPTYLSLTCAVPPKDGSSESAEPGTQVSQGPTP